MLDEPILITGATGTIGARLVARLPQARILTRNLGAIPKRLHGVPAFEWDGKSISEAALDGVQGVIHLAGESIADGRWTPAKKRAIEDSRILGTRALVAALGKMKSRPEAFLCASAVGYYGDRGDEQLPESSTPGDDFLAHVCVGWEREAKLAEGFGLRVTNLRMGVVLDRNGGALPQMLRVFRLGIGGPLGTGKQWMPWVHIDDAVGAVMHALSNPISGPMNIVSPEPARNEDFSRALGCVLYRPAFFRTPTLALEIALGEMSQVVLASTRALPDVATRSGYRFAHPSLDEALRDLLHGDEK